MQFSLLLLVEIADVVQFPEVTDIGEYPVCICHILVDVIEVGQQQLSPSVKLVKCLSHIAGHLSICFVEVAYTFDGIGHGQFGVLAEEIRNRNIGWTPERPSGHPCQCLVQEEGCPFVRKDDCYARHVRSVLVKQVLCYVFKECNHILKLRLPSETMED